MKKRQEKALKEKIKKEERSLERSIEIRELKKKIESPTGKSSNGNKLALRSSTTYVEKRQRAYRDAVKEKYDF